MYIQLTDRGFALLDHGHSATPARGEPSSSHAHPAHVDPFAAPTLGGVIFFVTDETWPECKQHGLLGFPPGRKREILVTNIKADMPLFAYSPKDRAIYGNLYATCTGRWNICAEAWNGQFPNQVRFRMDDTGLRKIEVHRVLRILTWLDSKHKFDMELTPLQVFDLQQALQKRNLYGEPGQV